MRWNASKLLVPLVALALVASSCGGGGDEAREIAEDFREMDAKDIEPPPRADPKAIGNPGLTLSTASATWRRLLDAPGGRGAVVLFVQPGAAADRKNIARGDMITKIDGQNVTNAEHAQSLLWMAPGDERTVTFVKSNGKDREVKLQGALLREDPMVYLNGMIKGNSSDPVLRYIRAGLGTFSNRLKDIDVALDEASNFVEALTRRGNLLMLAARAAKEEKQKEQLAGQALANFHDALDIIPRHAETLTSQSEAETYLGKGSQAKVTANRAIQGDATYAKANAALARAELNLKKPENALGPARAAVQVVPVGNLDYYRLLAGVFKALKRKSECQETLRAIVPWVRGTKTFAKEADRLESEAKEDCG